MKQILWRMRRFLPVICGILILSASVTVARAQTGNAGEVVVLEATGVILPSMGSYIERGLTDADRRNAEAVILVLDTPGGSGSVMLDIVQAIRTSDVPVIVFVGPRGASAGSAGLLITLAGHASAMAPDTAIGASSPISPSGENLPSTAEQKAKEFVSAEARSLAERRGPEAVALANAAVNEARAVTSSEALDAGLIDFIAENTDDLLTQLEGIEVEVNGHPRVLHTDQATKVPVPMNALEQFLLIIADPNIVSLLLSIGALLIFVEVRAPGGWVAGALGTIFLGLGLYGLGALPVNWLGGVFILLAFALFILEIKTPTHGVLTAAGAASLAVGFVVLFSQPALAPFGSLSIPVVIGEAVFIGAIFFFIALMALRAQSLRVTTGYPALIGQIGRVTQDVNPVGMVQVFGERWRAESEDGGSIPSGTQIEVIEASSMRLRVRPKA